MDKAVILDTETTGLIEPQPIQLAQTEAFLFNELVTQRQITVTQYKNSKPIEPGAMAVHRIIAADLEGCPDWPGWQAPQQTGYLIGHQIDHDWEVIGKPDLKRICTLAMAKHRWDGLGSYKLESLIFHLYEAAEARRMTENAHDAEVDVTLTGLLLDHLMWELTEITSFEQLWQYSENARIPTRIGFSKYGPKNGQPGTHYTEVPTGMLKWIVHPDRILEMDPWEVKATLRELQRRGAA